MSKHAEAARQALHAAAGAIAANAALPAVVRDRAADVLVDGDTMDAAAHLTAVALLHAELAAADAKAARVQAETTQGALDAAQEALEAALTTYLVETGAPAIDGGTHTLTLADGRPAVVITDAAALPACFLKPQPPKPDKLAIAAALKAGPVAGAVFANSRPSLRRSIKDRIR